MQVDQYGRIPTPVMLTALAEVGELDEGPMGISHQRGNDARPRIAPPGNWNSSATGNRKRSYSAQHRQGLTLRPNMGQHMLGSWARPDPARIAPHAWQGGRPSIRSRHTAFPNGQASEGDSLVAPVMVVVGCEAVTPAGILVPAGVHSLGAVDTHQFIATMAGGRDAGISSAPPPRSACSSPGRGL